MSDLGFLGEQKPTTLDPPAASTAKYERDFSNSKLPVIQNVNVPLSGVRTGKLILGIDVFSFNNLVNLLKSVQLETVG